MFYVLLMKLCSFNKKNFDFEQIRLHFSVEKGTTIREGATIGDNTAYE